MLRPLLLLLLLLLLLRKSSGQGSWQFADGLSFYEGTFASGQRVKGKLVMFDADTKKPVETYDGR
jgi:hypothetical protein